MKIKIKKILCIITGLIFIIFFLTGCENENIEKQKNPAKITSTLKNERIMSDGTYQIRFSDLVSLSSLQEYNNKTVTAIGYLSPITSYDGSFGYLMNLPYQTCPYCQPDDTKITNTIAIFAKKDKKIEFTEAAVIVKGTLKLEPHTDAYGYSYNYRITDVEITVADTSQLGDKIALYNDIADKKILASIMELLYVIDDNVYYEEYIKDGYKITRKEVDLTKINQVAKDLESFDQTKVKVLVNIADELKTIGKEINSIIAKKNYDKLEDHKEKLNNLFYSINKWMSDYQL